MTRLEIIKEEPASEKDHAPIVFVHGMWHAAWCWAEFFLPYFADHGYPSYALSLRGHGASEGRERLRWTSLVEYTADLAQVVGHMNRPPVLVGHSMGATAIQKHLETHRAPAAVLLAPVLPQGLLAATLRTLGRDPLAVCKVGVTWSLYPVISTPSRCREHLFSRHLPDDRVKAYFARMQDGSFRAYMDMMVLNLPRPKPIDTPVLVMGGANDAAIAIRELEATARAYGTQAEILPEMAHAMMLEPGWQAVADRILCWLDGQGL